MSTPAPAGTHPVRQHVHPHPEPRAYPQMLRTWDYAWWRPVVGILVLLVGLLVVAPFVLLPVLAAGVALDHQGSFADAFEKAAMLKSITPASMLYLNLALASGVLITWLIVRGLHRLRPRWLSSVRPGVRWRFLAACVPLAVLALGAQVVLASVLPGDTDGTGGTPARVTGRLVALGVVILLTTPLQALGEEFAFRGYLMQAVGSLTRSSWGAVLVTAVVFALAHGGQNVPLFADRLAFGLLAGYLVVRTGGLEAGIALHVVNNLVAFGFALAYGTIDSTLNVSSVSWWNLPLTVVQNGLYLVLVLGLARRMGVARTTSPEPAPIGG